MRNNTGGKAKSTWQAMPLSLSVRLKRAFLPSGWLCLGPAALSWGLTFLGGLSSLPHEIPGLTHQDPRV